jgi:hypothetical protein
MFVDRFVHFLKIKYKTVICNIKFQHPVTLWHHFKLYSCNANKVSPLLKDTKIQLIHNLQVQLSILDISRY